MANDFAPDYISSACNIVEPSSHRLSGSTCIDSSGEAIARYHQQFLQPIQLAWSLINIAPYRGYDSHLRTTYVKYGNADVQEGIKSKCRSVRRYRSTMWSGAPCPSQGSILTLGYTTSPAS